MGVSIPFPGSLTGSGTSSSFGGRVVLGDEAHNLACEAHNLAGFGGQAQFLESKKQELLEDLRQAKLNKVHTRPGGNPGAKP